MMEVVPSLCASGTVGVAAAGFVFGQLPNPSSTKTTARKRRATAEGLKDWRAQHDPLTAAEAGSDAATPTTSARTAPTLPHSTSAPISRLRKRYSAAWGSMGGLSDSSTPPQTPVSSKTTATSTTPLGTSSAPNVVRRKKSIDLVKAAAAQYTPPMLTGRRSFTFDFHASEAEKNAQSHPLSIVRPDSPAQSSGMDTVSATHSATSSVPMLGENIPPSLMAPRNKLIKRSASQRLLSGPLLLPSSSSASRRPATSHQRSVSLRQRVRTPEALSSSPASPGLPAATSLTDSGDGRPWQFFFRSTGPRDLAASLTRKRTLQEDTPGVEGLTTILPDVSDLPTLLLASSIERPGSRPALSRRPSTLSQLSRPFTPLSRHLETPEPLEQHSGPSLESDYKPRTSLSLGEMFRSSTPTSWKMPGSTSLPKKKIFRRRGERRVASAPLTAASAPGSRPHNLAYHETAASAMDTDDTPSRRPTAQRAVSGMRPYQSTLPPLNRLSSFNLDVPFVLPSFPSTPLLDQPSPLASNPPVMVDRPTSPPHSYLRKRPGHVVSGAYSDNASTLLESDNDTSRMLSGSDDETDGRSGTAYDSTRTGATSISISGSKRPRIDTIFDESPPPDAPHEDQLLAFKDLQINEAKVVDYTRVSSPTEIILTPGVGKRGSLSSQDLLFATTTNTPAAADGDARGVDVDASDAMDVDMDDDHQQQQQAGHEASGYGLPNRNSQSHQVTVPSGTATVMTSVEQDPSWSPNHIVASTEQQDEKANTFQWSEQTTMDTSGVEEAGDSSSRAKGMQGQQTAERGARLNVRRGPPQMHLRSQSVPVPHDSRGHNSASHLNSWILGNKGPSEEWDGDFDFDEAPRAPNTKALGSSGSSNGNTTGTGNSAAPGKRTSLSMRVPDTILERQASVHGQFGHVKELTKLVEELKRLRSLGRVLGVVQGQSAELWKEAEGIINLATVDDEDLGLLPPGPCADGDEPDFFDEESPFSSSARRPSASTSTPPKASSNATSSVTPAAAAAAAAVTAPSVTATSVAAEGATADAARTEHAKSVLEHIHQQRSQIKTANGGRPVSDMSMTERKLPFDTTSLKDLVTRAGVVTRALKEEIRRAETRRGSVGMSSSGSTGSLVAPSSNNNTPSKSDNQQPLSSTDETGESSPSQAGKANMVPRDPPFSAMFQPPTQGTLGVGETAKVSLSRSASANNGQSQGHGQAVESGK